MAFTFLVNQNPTTSAVAMYNIKETLKSVGWTVTSSSDGTTYNSSGDQITTGASGAGGLANSNAWFVIRHPSLDGYQRSLCIQRTTANTTYRIKYSFNAGFTGGSPGATRVPSATDEVVLLGAGTDAAPTGAVLFGGTEATYRHHIIVGDGSNDGYSFYSIGYSNGGATATHAFLMDRMETGSFQSQDIDPYVFFLSSSANMFAVASPQFYSTTVAFAWFRKGYSDEGFVNLAAFFNLDSSNSTAVLGTNAITGNDDLLPILYGRRVSLAYPSGFKGKSKNILMLSTTRSNGDTLTYSTSQDKIVLQTVVFPWDGSTPTV